MNGESVGAGPAREWAAILNVSVIYLILDVSVIHVLIICFTCYVLITNSIPTILSTAYGKWATVTAAAYSGSGPGMDQPSYDQFSRKSVIGT